MVIRLGLELSRLRLGYLGYLGTYYASSNAAITHLSVCPTTIAQTRAFYYTH